MRQQTHSRRSANFLVLVDSILQRVFEIVFSLICLTVFSPILIVVIFIIKILTNEPGIFIQKRRGVDNTEFYIIKVRTIFPRVDSDNCSFLPKLSHILRKYHIDEIPQFLLILRGEMGLVGPRPICIEEDKQIQCAISAWSSRYAVRPGLTGLAQVQGYDTQVPNKMLEHDLKYINRKYIFLDMYIILTHLFRIGCRVVS